MIDSSQDFNPFTIGEVQRKSGCRDFRDHCFTVLNNFIFFIPGGNTPYPLPESTATNGYYFTLAVKRGLLQRESIHKHDVSGTVQIITVQKFFEELNEVLEQNNKTEVLQAVNPFYAKNIERNEKYSFFFWKKLLPVYIAMRKRGFSQKVLWT